MMSMCSSQPYTGEVPQGTSRLGSDMTRVQCEIKTFKNWSQRSRKEAERPHSVTSTSRRLKVDRECETRLVCLLGQFPNEP